MKKTKKICVTLSEQQFETLQQLADESFRTRSGYIRRLIAAYIEHIEKYPNHKLS